MKRKPLLWYLFPAFVLAVLSTLGAMTWYASKILTRLYISKTEQDLLTTSYALEPQILPLLQDGNLGKAKALFDRLEQHTGTRFTLILKDGSVVADSQTNAPLENHAERPEIKTAFTGEIASSARLSPTLHVRMHYLALPIKHADRVVAVLRASRSYEQLEDELLTFKRRMLQGGLFIAASSILLSLVLARSFRRPLTALKESAERFSRGEFSHRVEVAESEEIHSTAEALNRMASQLEEQMQALVKQRNELEAVLSSMTEAVIAVDLNGRVLSLNNVAAQLLGATGTGIQGMTITDVARDTELPQLIGQIFDLDHAVAGEVAFHHQRERIWQLHGTALRDSKGERIGALVVMNDVTDVRQLERIRRDFVANVSHELKTPITAICGFVETLLDGALEDKAQAEQFLRIVYNHSQRLAAIINDLLTLSRIEQDAGKSQIPLEIAKLMPILRNAAGLCEGKARSKGLVITLIGNDTTEAHANPALLEQAVVNLIDNAIKYSDGQKEIAVSLDMADDQYVISVKDQGFGIAAEHLDRLFERFYRVDTGRSRKAGGTGLGLAIVKHIAQAHGGRAFVTSVVGEGSTFTLQLPCKPFSDEATT